MKNVLLSIPFPRILLTGLHLGLGIYVGTKSARVEVSRVILGGERLKREEGQEIVIR